MGGGMKFDVHENGDTAIINFSGDIDMECSSRVRDAILGLTGKTRTLTVNLAEVDVIDSTGIATLVEGMQQARRHGNKMLLGKVSPPVMKVLKLANLDSVFEFSEPASD